MGTAIRFERGLLVADTEENPATGATAYRWRHDRRTGLWVSDAQTNAEMGDPLGEVARWQTLGFPRARLKVPRPYQVDAVEAWERAGRRGVLGMATGTGKTEVAITAIHRCATHTLVVEPTRALAYQIADRIERALGTPVGYIGDGTYSLRAVTVATYDSACRKMEFLGDYFRLVIFDECHHLPGPVRGDAARMSAAPWRMGLSATPYPAGDRSELDRLIGPECYRRAIGDAVGAELAAYRVVRIPVRLTDSERKEYDALGGVIRNHLAGRRGTNPEYDWRDVCGLVATDPEARRAFYAHHRRVAIEDGAREKLEVVEDLFCQHHRQTVVYAGSNKMAREVSLRFLIPCILANSSRKERCEILAKFADGRFRAVVANKILNEGIDIENAKVGIVIGGSGSAKDAEQRLGRLLRKYGGSEAVLYEVVCAETGEEERSRKRRRSDAYKI